MKDLWHELSRFFPLFLAFTSLLNLQKRRGCVQPRPQLLQSSAFPMPPGYETSGPADDFNYISP
jgi:hypothetical protein